MNGEAVKEMAERFRKPEQVGDVIAAPTDWKLFDPNELIKPAPKAAAFVVATLASLVEYLKTNRDALDLTKVIVHIETPNRVSIGGSLRERSRDREMYLTAQAEDMTDGFIGKYHTIEHFIIGLQVRFCDCDDRAKLLEFVSNVRTEQSATTTDDGVSQTLTARGVALVSALPVPNPVTLTPFRTFRDIPQPTSPYILRAHATAGQLPQLALMEADGGVWKLSTLGKIRDHLVGYLGDAIAVLA